MDGIRHIWQFGHGYFKSVGTDSMVPGAPAGTRAKQAARLAAAIRTALGTGAQEGSLVADTGEPVYPGWERREGVYAVGGSRNRFEVAIPLADAVDGPALERLLVLLLDQNDGAAEAGAGEGVSPAVIVGWWVDGTRLIADRALLVEGSRAAFALAGELGLTSVYSFARDKAQSVRTLAGDKRAEWAQDAWGAYNMFRRATSPANSLPGTGEPVDTGLRDLDQTLNGLHPGSLTIVAGRRGAGKTSFALTLAANAAKQGAAVLYFSLELSADEAAGCLLCAEARTPIADARRGMLTDDERHFLDEAAQRLEKLDLAFIDDAETYKDICAEARRRLDGSKRKALVIVDDLQLAVAWPDDGSTRDEALAAATQAFKALARNVHAPVVAVSQLTHAIEERPDKQPTLADLPGAGALEQDADVVLLVDNTTIEKGIRDGRFSWTPLATASIIVAKNRLGQSDIETPVALAASQLTMRGLFSTTYMTPYVTPNALVLQTSDDPKTALTIDMSPCTDSSLLDFILGADNNDEPIWEDFDSLHHLVIASGGDGGSRKKLNSILDTMVLSILARATPDEVRLILMDYNCGSLSKYHGVPHLLMPPVTEERFAQTVLQQCVDEIARRHDTAARIGDIGEQALPKLPRLLVVIGELADLLIIANEKLVTKSIVEIARYGHAVGVHIIIGTCFADSLLNLSAEPILTAIPSCIYCTQKSKTPEDAHSGTSLRRFIDTPDWPEHNGMTHDGVLALLGPSQSSNPRHVRVYNIDADEMLHTIARQNRTDDDSTSFGPASMATTQMKPTADPVIPSSLINEAARFVVETQNGSASAAQRHLKLGYRKTQAIIQILHHLGIVGTPSKQDASFPVLVSNLDELNRILGDSFRGKDYA